ncbi:MAG TPA: flagellar protein FlaG [Gammaproteobacteria bacterium]|jgi:flagellar protein FlaG|nr:flagellar protein FlaG [Gammaproteobacteria bacterium]
MSNSILQSTLIRDVLPNSRPAALEAAGKSVGGNTLPTTGEVQPSQPPTEEKVAGTDISDAVKTLSTYVQNMSRELHISVDEDSGRTVIRVIDPDSKEVIRQIPEEEILALARDGLEDRDRGRLLRAQA